MFRQQWFLLSIILAFRNALGQSEVPVQGTCHRVITGSSSGSLNSHKGYPDIPYPIGHNCRLVIAVPNDEEPEVFIGEGQISGLRPWDYAIIVDGRVAKNLNFICDVNKYKKLGKRGEDYVEVLKRHFDEDLSSSLKSSSSTIVVDFCVSPYTGSLANRKGFTIRYITEDENDVTDEESLFPLVVPNAGDSEVVHPNLPINPAPLIVQNGRCGIPQNPPSQNPNRIVNGVFARENSWPWICAMVKRPREHICGCTLIKDQWVVTAAHCVDSLGADFVNLDIYLGVENLVDATNVTKYKITKVIIHEFYNIPSGSSNNDIALLKLDRAVPVSDDALPACLPSQSVHVRVPSAYTETGRRVCYVAGWGHLFDEQSRLEGGKIGAGSDLLKQISVEVMAQVDCMKYMMPEFLITNEMFCAGFDRGKYDSCQGDSGGPMVCDDGTGHWTLYGIVSHGRRCAQDRSPGIYTNVAQMMNWINAAIDGDGNLVQKTVFVRNSIAAFS